MSILLSKDTKVVVQGITGEQAKYQVRLMREYGTNIVAGAVPGRGGTTVDGIPVYETVSEARLVHGVAASMMFVPARFVLDGVLEAIDAGLGLVVCLADGVPVHDMILIKRKLRGTGTIMVGPNSPGLLTVGEAKLGIMPSRIYKKGNVGIISRSGTMSYQIAKSLTAMGIGQSTCVGIGGDPVPGCAFIDVLRLFEKDEDTRAVVLVGEIGGSQEEQAAEFVKEEMSKPVIAFIAGRMAPPEKRMGHAGAIVSGGRGSFASKAAALERASITLVQNVLDLPRVVHQLGLDPTHSM